MPASTPRRPRKRTTLPYNGLAPMIPGSPTSEAAAKKIEPVRMTKREQVYAFILSRGATGATRREIAEALGMSENTVRPRVCELMNEHDDEYDRARVKVSPDGAERRGCAVLLAAPFYPSWADKLSENICYAPSGSGEAL